MLCQTFRSSCIAMSLCTSHDPSDHRVSDQVLRGSFDYSNPQNPILMASSTSSIFYMLKPILLILLLMKLLTPLLCSRSPILGQCSSSLHRHSRGMASFYALHCLRLEPRSGLQDS